MAPCCYRYSGCFAARPRRLKVPQMKTQKRHTLAPYFKRSLQKNRGAKRTRDGRARYIFRPNLSFLDVHVAAPLGRRAVVRETT